MNPWNASYVEGVGQNQWQRPVFGQFFPSTPQIPGAVLHVPKKEYGVNLINTLSSIPGVQLESFD